MYTDKQKTTIVREALVYGRGDARRMYQIPEATLRGWMTAYDQNCAICGESLSTMWKEKGTIEYANVDGIPASLVGECCLKVVDEYRIQSEVETVTATGRLGL